MGHRESNTPLTVAATWTPSNITQKLTKLMMAGVMTTMRTMTTMNRQDDKDNDDNKKGRQKGKRSNKNDKGNKTSKATAATPYTVRNGDGKGNIGSNAKPSQTAPVIITMDKDSCPQ